MRPQVKSLGAALAYHRSGSDHTPQPATEMQRTGGGGGVGGLSGVMIGRAAYNASWDTLATADTAVFGEAADPAVSRRQVVKEYLDYAEGWHAQAVAGGGSSAELQDILCQPLLGLVSAEECPAWREKLLSGADALLEGGGREFALRALVRDAQAAVPAHVLDTAPQATVLDTAPQATVLE